MALKAKVANKVQVNDNGLVEGTLIQVLETDERIEVEKGKDIKYESQFEFHIEVPGTQKNVIYKLWTGKNINNEKYEKPDKTVDYNKLTKLLLQLGAITESQLKDLSKLNDFDIESVEGLKIQFELQPSKKGNGLKEPKVSTIKPLTVPPTK